MKDCEKALLKSKIDSATLISFDIFDTLLFRKVNTPETVFELMGQHFGIHGFKKLRVDAQNEASIRMHRAYQYPHADMNEIYKVLAEHTEVPVDWMQVKAYEIQMERDVLVPNREMQEIYEYAKSQGKRIVITSDMYLLSETLGDILREKGFDGFDYLYCSADEHKAKFMKTLYEVVAEKEQVPYEEILHIGDKEVDDGQYPEEYGIQTHVYRREADMEKVKSAVSSDVDKGIYKILCDPDKGFWYNLGVEVGGPLYLGLYRYMLETAMQQDKKVFFLSRDGYNLYEIFKRQGYKNIEYLYTSRRALTMAAITEMNQRDIDSLPPYTKGQTVGELLDFLGMDRSAGFHVQKAGFETMEDIIKTEEDIDAFKQLYTLDKDIFLEQCKKERENALKYYNKIGFFDEDAICFDCGWQGSSQELLEKFKEAAGIKRDNFFYYCGIKNSDKSRRQLRGLHYDTYLFDFYKNYALQADLKNNVFMYELFFSAPHKSVSYYDGDGEPVFEDGEFMDEKADIFTGIYDFLQESLDFVEKYDVECTPEKSIGHLRRLIYQPTEEEAVTIGNLTDVDSFGKKQDGVKYIAYLTEEQIEHKYNIDVFWPDGLVARPDVSEKVKRAVAINYMLAYPKKKTLYHLEDEGNLRVYQRWNHYHEKHVAESLVQEELEYKPFFSFVIPVYNTVTEQLDQCIQSVLAQTYDNYELILVDDHSSWGNVVPTLQKYEENPHVRVIYRETNGHISEATNDGIRVAKGEFIVFMDCDDVVEVTALYEFAKKLNENPELDFIYSDEDKVTEDGSIKHMPYFKPDWSPDLFMSMMYTNHLATYRTSIIREVGGLRSAYNGSQDYDFTLRFMERSNNSRVGHVPKILYHWRERKESLAYASNSKNYAAEAARHAKEDYIKRNGLKAHLEYIAGMAQYRIVYEVVGNPLVSIIIPSKDHYEVLKQCIDSIREYTIYENYEMVVVDNGSSEENKKLIEVYLSEVGAKYIYEKEEFNFSKMCNTGAKHADGEYVLFLNDDIEIFQPDWLNRMLGHGQQKRTGAVGAKLFYPFTQKIQHVGIANAEEAPKYILIEEIDEPAYYFGLNRVDANVLAVTGACLLVAKSKFDEVGGFDESFAVTYNDVKLCFALHAHGYYNVIRNDVMAYHHESLSRGLDYFDDAKIIRQAKERMALYREFPELRYKDPYMNENFKMLGSLMDMKRYYDELIEIEPMEANASYRASIDHISIEDRVIIRGWSLFDEEKHVEKLERYLVFQDPYGHTYASKTFPATRVDVAMSLDDEDYIFSGFETFLRKQDLRLDILSYKMGVMTIDGAGNKYLCWCHISEIMRNPEPCICAPATRLLKDYRYNSAEKNVRWSIDKVDTYDSYLMIQGYAFIKDVLNYRYHKSLVLVSDDGEAYEFDVQVDRRMDVAYAFPEEAALYYTGFVCDIFKGMIDPNKDYRVIIRLANSFDRKDIVDIDTGRKVRLS